MHDTLADNIDEKGVVGDVVRSSLAGRDDVWGIELVRVSSAVARTDLEIWVPDDGGPPLIDPTFTA